MARPLGAKNKHPATLTIQINLTDEGKRTAMKKMTIKQLGQSIEQAHNALGKLTGCVTALSSVLEVKDSIPDLERVANSLKNKKQSYLDELKKRTDYKKPYERVIFEVRMKYTPKPQNIAMMLERGERDVLERRQKYTSVGISSDKALELIPDYDPSAELAKIEESRAIADAWEKLNETGLESDLPANAAEMLEQIGTYEEFAPSNRVGRSISVMG
jgi:uncharacterized phage infection (PIP) family protein YhgE